MIFEERPARSLSKNVRAKRNPLVNLDSREEQCSVKLALEGFFESALGFQRHQIIQTSCSTPHRSAAGTLVKQIKNLLE